MRRVYAVLAVLCLPLVFLLARTASAAGGVSATYATTSSWGSGYQGQYTIKNAGTSSISSWTIEFDLPAGSKVTSAWDATLTSTGDHYTLKSKDYNGQLAPGASASLGFLASGTGTPGGCKLNGGSCDAGPTGPPTTPPAGGPAPYAVPYVDMGAWPTPVLSDMASASGLKGFTMAFITSVQCKASWFNAYDPRTGWERDEIDKIRAAGADVKISFGGASGTELAQDCTDDTKLYNEYAAVADAYSAKYFDFDIEGAAVADHTSVDRRSRALAHLQQTHPGLKISLTLPVLPEGLTADGLYIVQSAKNAGVKVDLVNVMAMDYYRSGTDYGDAAVQAAQSTYDQLQGIYGSAPWSMVGVTPMLGENDDHNIYNQDDARQLVAFAKQHHLGELAFWEETRDRNACTGATYKCTNVPQQPYEFSKIFAGYTG